MYYLAYLALFVLALPYSSLAQDNKKCMICVDKIVCGDLDRIVKIVSGSNPITVKKECLAKNKENKKIFNNFVYNKGLTDLEFGTFSYERIKGIESNIENNIVDIDEIIAVSNTSLRSDDAEKELLQEVLTSDTLANQSRDPASDSKVSGGNTKNGYWQTPYAPNYQNNLQELEEPEQRVRQDRPTTMSKGYSNYHEEECSGGRLDPAICYRNFRDSQKQQVEITNVKPDSKENPVEEPSSLNANRRLPSSTPSDTTMPSSPLDLPNNPNSGIGRDNSYSSSDASEALQSAANGAVSNTAENEAAKPRTKENYESSPDFVGPPSYLANPKKAKKESRTFMTPYGDIVVGSYDSTSNLPDYLRAEEDKKEITCSSLEDWDKHSYVILSNKKEELDEFYTYDRFCYKDNVQQSPVEQNSIQSINLLDSLPYTSNSIEYLQSPIAGKCQNYAYDELKNSCEKHFPGIITENKKNLSIIPEILMECKTKLENYINTSDEMKGIYSYALADSIYQVFNCDNKDKDKSEEEIVKCNQDNMASLELDPNNKQDCMDLYTLLQEYPESLENKTKNFENKKWFQFIKYLQAQYGKNIMTSYNFELVDLTSKKQKNECYKNLKEGMNNNIENLKKGNQKNIKSLINNNGLEYHFKSENYCTDSGCLGLSKEEVDFIKRDVKLKRKKQKTLVKHLQDSIYNAATTLRQLNQFFEVDANFCGNTMNPLKNSILKPSNGEQ